MFQGKLDFASAFSSGGDGVRQAEGERLLAELTADKCFDVKAMFKILRHKDSFICRGVDDTFPTQGSQVTS